MLTKQCQQWLQGKVHGATVGLFARLQHHLLLTDLTQVKPWEKEKDRALSMDYSISISTHVLKLLLPRAARNSWQPGSLQSCTLMDTWMGAREKSCSFSPDWSCTKTWWSCGKMRKMSQYKRLISLLFTIKQHSQISLAN